MLGVGLRKLCPQDSFGYAFREKKTVRKSTPGGCKSGPWGVQNGFREASGRLFLCKWAQLGRQGRSEAVFGRLWGRSWDAFGALGAVLGPSGPLLGRPGPLLGASWGHVGSLGTLLGDLGASPGDVVGLHGRIYRKRNKTNWFPFFL